MNEGNNQKENELQEKKNADAYDKKVLLQITHAILNRMRYEILKYIRWEMSLCQLRWERMDDGKKRMIMKIIFWICVMDGVNGDILDQDV